MAAAVFGLQVLLFAPSLAAQASGSSAETLKVAFGTVPEPLLIRPEQGPPQGLIPDFWRVWSRYAGREVELVAYDTNTEARDAVRNGDADFLASLPITHLPEEGFALTLPYARLTQGLISPRQDLRIEEIEGQILRYEAEVSEGEAAALLTGLEIRGLESTSGSFSEIFAEATEPVLTPSMRMSLRRMQKEGIDDDLHVIPFSSRFIFAATAIDRPDLAALFDRYLATVSYRDLESLGAPDGSFGLPPFFLEPRDRFKLSDEEVEWLQEHPVVRLGASPWEPLTIVDEAGRYTGIAIETLRQTLARLGVYLIVVGNDDWNTVVQQAASGEIDGLGFTAPREDADFLYTDPILDAPIVAVNRSNAPFFSSLDELSEGRIAIPSEYGLLERLQLLHGSRLQFIPTASSEDSARLVSRGDADVMVDFLPNAQSAIRSQSITNLKAAASLDDTSPRLATALRPDWSALVGLLNRGVASRTREEQTRLFERFMTPEPEKFNRNGFLVLIGLLLLTILGLAGSAAVRRQKTGRMLRESEELLRRAERVSNSGSWKLDRDTDEVTFSAESYRLFGWQPGTTKLALADFCDLYEPGAREALRAAIEATSSPGSAASAPFVLGLKDGQHSHRCFVEGVGETQVIGTLTDVTREEQERRERQRLEAQIHQTERLDALGRLAGGIAHDFNNILAVGLANAELAKLDLTEEHPALQSVEEFIKASVRGKELVQQIQIFGRRKNPERRRIDLSDNVRAVVGLLRASLPPSIEVSADLLASPLWINASTTEVDRALMNLGINAGQAMPDGGRLRFVVRRESVSASRTTSTGVLEPGDYSVVEVTDTGIGIDSEHLPHIFEPYFTHRADGDGTGLGLSIVHGTVVDHGGHLEVHSGSAGSEATTAFTLYLPEAVADPAPQGDLIREEAASLEPIGRGERVLLIDDEEMLVESNRKLFEKLGLQPVAHTNPKTALEAFREAPQSFAVVVTDLLMPELTGVEVAEAIRELRDDCPIVLTTGYAAEHDLTNAPVDFIVDKPVSASRWVQVFRDTLPKAVQAAV